MHLRIILADDHPFVLLGYRAMLAVHAGVTIAGEARIASAGDVLHFAPGVLHGATILDEEVVLGREAQRSPVDAHTPERALGPGRPVLLADDQVGEAVAVEVAGRARADGSFRGPDPALAAAAPARAARNASRLRCELRSTPSLTDPGAPETDP